MESADVIVITTFTGVTQLHEGQLQTQKDELETGIPTHKQHNKCCLSAAYITTATGRVLVVLLDFAMKMFLLIVSASLLILRCEAAVESCSKGGATAEQRWFGCKESCPDDWATLKQDPRGNTSVSCSSGTRTLCLCNCTSEWKGTSPFCKGECPTAATLVRKDKKGDGFSCLSGEKALCRTCTYTKRPQTFTTVGVLRTEPSGLGDDRTRPSTARYPTVTPRRFTDDWDSGTRRPTGRFSQETPDWRQPTKNPNGRFGQETPDWRQPTNGPNGRFGQETPDWRQTTKSPFGRFGQETPDWRQTTRGPNGRFGQETPDWRRPTGRFDSQTTAGPFGKGGGKGSDDGCHSVWIGRTPSCDGWCPDGWNVVDKSSTGPGWSCSSGQKFRCQKCDGTGTGSSDVAVTENRQGHVRASG